MSTSLIILSIIILLVMFGVGQRILDSLRLTDRAALLILVLICIGLIIPPIWIGQYFCFSIGGFLIPLALSIYLLICCGWSRDLLRAFIGTILVAGVIYGLEWLLPADPEDVIIDNMYLYGIVAGLIAYALGRSRRNTFISCLFGLTLASLVQWIVNFSKGTPSILGLGVGGAFGTYIVSLIIAVAISEFLGRCFENAKQGDETEIKKFNYKTSTYDSVKNGKLTEEANTKQSRINNIKRVKNAKPLNNIGNIAKKSKSNSKNEKVTKIVRGKVNEETV